MATKPTPDTGQTAKETPAAAQPRKKMPASKPAVREKPQVGNPENTVMIGST